MKSPYFGILYNRQSYINLAYLLLAFPLGILYFVFLVTGISTGVSLTIVWVGIPILALVFAVSAYAGKFERLLANHLLGQSITDPQQFPASDKSFGQRIISYLKTPTTWTTLLYMLLKFPLGIASFVATVTVMSTTLAFITSPFFYRFGNINFGWWQIDTLREALILAVVGMLILPASLHILSGLAWLNGAIAQLLLGGFSPRSRFDEKAFAV